MLVYLLHLLLTGGVLTGKPGLFSAFLSLSSLGDAYSASPHEQEEETTDQTQYTTDEVQPDLDGDIE